MSIDILIEKSVVIRPFTVLQNNHNLRSIFDVLKNY
jgi:hypothetical protein